MASAGREESPWPEPRARRHRGWGGEESSSVGRMPPCCPTGTQRIKPVTLHGCCLLLQYGVLTAPWQGVGKSTKPPGAAVTSPAIPCCLRGDRQHGLTGSRWGRKWFWGPRCRFTSKSTRHGRSPRGHHLPPGYTAGKKGDAPPSPTHELLPGALGPQKFSPYPVLLLPLPLLTVPPGDSCLETDSLLFDFLINFFFFFLNVEIFRIPQSPPPQTMLRAGCWLLGTRPNRFHVPLLAEHPSPSCGKPRSHPPRTHRTSPGVTWELIPWGFLLGGVIFLP